MGCGYVDPVVGKHLLEFSLTDFFLLFGISTSWRQIMGGPCSNILCISSLLFLNPWGPTFHYTAFSSLFIEIEPDILRFKSQLILGILSSLMVLNSIQRFHPVRIGSKIAFFFLAYVPVIPNMFSASDPSSIISLLSRFWIQDPMLVLRARKNSTINCQECLGTWVRQSNRVNVFSKAKFADRRELLEGAWTERRDWDKRLALGAVCSAFTWFNDICR